MRSAPDIADLLSTASTIGHLGPYEITDDPDRVSIDVVHEFLSRHSRASPGVDVDRVEASIRMSLPLSVHLATCTPSMVGFLRVVTDTVTRSWLEDLFVLREHRRRGIAAALVRAALGHPAVSGTTTTVESPPDVQALFTGQGFRPVADTRTRRLATDRARFATAVGQEPSVNCLHRPTADRPQRVGHDTSRGEGDERHQP